MPAEPGIREAVRQLGRAVAALVRAVVGAVGRKRPAAAGTADGGPPQEWLDLVAQTDPDWLARSQWAPRAAPTRHPRPSRRRRLDTTRVVPGDEPGLEEERVATEVVQDHRPSSVPSAPTKESPAAAEEVPLGDTRQPVRHHATRLQPRRLVLVEPGTDTVPAMPRPLADAPTPRTDAAALAELADPPASSDAGDFPRHRPLAKAPAPWEEAPSLGKRETWEEAAGQDSSSEHRESVRLEPGPRRPARETGPLPAHVEEMPGTWTLAPTRPHPALVPTDRPSAATALTWPELPRTESLDEPDPTPGLAARLWLADDRPDSLTTAQRRS
jgi:hypothetical protein